MKSWYFFKWDVPGVKPNCKKNPKNKKLTKTFIEGIVPIKIAFQIFNRPNYLLAVAKSLEIF